MTASVALAAMAASIAEPPARRAQTPTCEARLCGHATIPRRANVGGRPVVIFIISDRLYWQWASNKLRDTARCSSSKDEDRGNDLCGASLPSCSANETKVTVSEHVSDV